MNNYSNDLKIFINNLKTNCSKTICKSFSKGDVITSYIKNRNQICIVEKGKAEIFRYNKSGQKILIDDVSENDLFGEVFYKITLNNEIVVKAKTDCSIVFFDYNYIYHHCPNNCSFHNEIIDFFNLLIMDKITYITQRVEFLTKKTIREKLLAYFETISTSTLSSRFKLSISFTDLANYLCVDRSAMMRELKLLESENIISRKNKDIKLK